MPASPAAQGVILGFMRRAAEFEMSMVVVDRLEGVAFHIQNR